MMGFGFLIFGVWVLIDVVVMMKGKVMVFGIVGWWYVFGNM